MSSRAAKRDLLGVADLAEDLPELLDRAGAMKEARRHGDLSGSLVGTNVALIFEKPSTRTRTSFEVGLNDLGGRGVYLSSKEMQLGRGETIADTARVLSRYVDAIVYRAFRHTDMVELAKHATVPVINALDDREHPCQIVADLLTMKERWGTLKGQRLAYIGDGNNVLNSLLLGCAITGVHLASAIPKAYRPPADFVEDARELAEESGARLTFTESPAEAANDADALYTDVWVSMGDEAQQAERERAFAGFRIDAALLAQADPAAFVLHDLPAHRGLEITDDVLDGPRAAVWDQAENRLHAQKAILERLIRRE